DSIDDEIINDIDLISRNHLNSLYDIERYKYRKHSIALHFPKIEHPAASHIIKSRDNLRFILSLYPTKDDLRAVDRIIMRPRHIESGGIELMALYIRSSKTLVHYLYVPHSYDINHTDISLYNEDTVFEVSQMVNRNVHHLPRDDENQIHPLLYILSMLYSSGNAVDKFFVRIDALDNAGILSQLDEVSDHYTRHGY
ncbi:MAG TPA: hypothetical protein VF857_01350, partial [Spirochaetota bacterium]